MTTYTYSGFDQFAEEPTTLQVVVPDGQTAFSYVSLERFSDSIADVRVLSDAYNVRLGGEEVLDDPNIDVLVAAARINGNATTYFIDFDTFSENGIFILGGATIPLNAPIDPDSVELANLFSSPFAPGTQLDLNDIPNRRVTENDRIIGTDADDLFLGGLGRDNIQGGGGNDVLDGGPGGDVLNGGMGRDVASYESATTSVRVDLQNSQFMFGDAVGDRFNNIEVFRTGMTADQLRGDAGDNEFFTGGFSDRLYGRAGDDRLFGEGGADAIYGGLGADRMTGGAGDIRDRFIYFNMAETGLGRARDVITDFVSGEDRIEISRFDADETRGGNQEFDFIGQRQFSSDAGELRYERVGSSTIVQGDTDGDGDADFEIQLLGRMTLDADDFLL